jgi:1-aminocyclopropane-1-carboxylate deaminase
MLEKFERYPLTFGPSPIEKLSRLTEHLGGKVDIYAKREDCNSGLAFGGNKIRKLEYIVPDAIASNADTLVTIGGVQSNHTRQVAAVAAKLGMKCRLVQEGWVPFEDAVYDRVGNILMSRVMGAEIELVNEGFDIGAPLPTSRPRAANPTPSPPAPRCINSAAWAMSALPKRYASRKPKWVCISISLSSAPSPARPMPAWWSALPRTGGRAT